MLEDTDGDGKPDNTDQFPTDPNDGEYSDSDGDGIPDAYDPDFTESGAGAGDGGTEGGGESEAGGQGEGQECTQVLQRLLLMSRPCRLPLFKLLNI